MKTLLTTALHLLMTDRLFVPLNIVLTPALVFLAAMVYGG